MSFARTIVQGFCRWRCKKCGEVKLTEPRASLNCEACFENRGKSIAMSPQKPGRYGIAKSRSPFAGGRSYDSNFERRFADELRTRELAGDVRHIVEKAPVDLLVWTWRIDFACEERQPDGTWRFVRYETKGPEDREYRRNLKLYDYFGDAPLLIVKEHGKRRAIERIIPTGGPWLRTLVEAALTAHAKESA